MSGDILGSDGARRARWRLLAAASVPFTIGILSK